MWRFFLYCVKLAHIIDASAKALNRTELPSFTSWKTMLIYPCAKCIYCCWDPTTQSNELGPIWYLQRKLGFRRNSFMSLWPWHVPLAWHVSYGVNSPNSLATILGTVNLNANLSHNVFHLHEQTYQYLSLITDSHSDSQNSSSLGNKKIHQFLVPATCLPPKDSIPASSNLPCFSKRKAKLFTEVSVSGCWAPSWYSRPSNARRWRPSAWRLEMER